MKVIEHIKPKGECTLKVKVWLWDRRIDFRVLEQRRRIRGRIWAAVNSVAVEIYDYPELFKDTIYLRGSLTQEDKTIACLDFRSNTERDAYYAKMKVALAAAAEAMK